MSHSPNKDGQGSKPYLLLINCVYTAHKLLSVQETGNNARELTMTVLGKRLNEPMRVILVCAINLHVYSTLAKGYALIKLSICS